MVRVIQPSTPSSLTSFVGPPPAPTAQSSPPEPNTPTTYTIPAPPEREYNSEEAAEAAIHDWTRAHDFDVSCSQVGRNANDQIRYRLYACVHTGKPKNTRKVKDADRQRLMATSKRDGCDMRISIKTVDALNPAGKWRIVHTRDGSQTHNHPPSYDVRVHVPHRQPDAQRQNEVRDLVELQAKAGVPTAKIYSTLIWMPGEAEPNFIWALSTLKAFMIEQSIYMAKFDDVINASSEIEYDKLCAELHALSPAMQKYLTRTWWPYRAKFVSAWTNKYSHFGCHTTSPVEGTHAKTKQWLDN
ncbi:hypothetical protein PHYSODRAFT_294911 [Phytophthora sojae]|uniref:FAR1 domain-containing protein n=1 Tax=Phytophthora sojae (strain P6497) TaxID=1094619 RepID=G4YL56_PHYSP|nr:hypothetical protein PHYSODRAFT_294911 [Phytophthora sojae]EGZ29971.1 hypothetical protein PHYSODRAFT_294911 [Phytophthora sojae]|eukprot:XP_009517246.1 hypothetical protein PHYSODRAFT_294911 [Phytophthora sojae]